MTSLKLLWFDACMERCIQLKDTGKYNHDANFYCKDFLKAAREAGGWHYGENSDSGLRNYIVGDEVYSWDEPL